MASCGPFVAAAYADNRAADLRSIVEKPLYQRSAVMGTIGIAKA